MLNQVVSKSLTRPASRSCVSGAESVLSGLNRTGIVGEVSLPHLVRPDEQIG